MKLQRSATSRVSQECFASTGPITLYFLFAIGMLLVEIPALEEAQFSNKALRIMEKSLIIVTSY